MKKKEEKMGKVERRRAITRFPEKGRKREKKKKQEKKRKKKKARPRGKEERNQKKSGCGVVGGMWCMAKRYRTSMMTK